MSHVNHIQSGLPVLAHALVAQLVALLDWRSEHFIRIGNVWTLRSYKWSKIVLLTFITLDRSFPSHKMFIEGTNEGKEGRAALFRVLAVYAMYNPQVSYCQGTQSYTVQYKTEHVTQQQLLTSKLRVVMLFCQCVINFALTPPHPPPPPPPSTI